MDWKIRDVGAFDLDIITIKHGGDQQHSQNPHFKFNTTNYDYKKLQKIRKKLTILFFVVLLLVYIILGFGTCIGIIDTDWSGHFVPI